jgi:hypothetical protein
LTFHWYDGVVPPFVGVAVNVTAVPEQTLLIEAEMVTLTANGVTTVIWITFDSAAPDQFDKQLTRAIRLYHVVCVVTPGEKDAELLAGISEKPELLPVVESCHLYSRVPVCPVGKVRLANGEGVKLPHPV